MTNFIPVFPLGLVLFPGEQLHLHIFEPRYKQLIQECATQKKLFGIPAVVNNKICEMGTTADIIEISKTYDNGEMDIKVKGIALFRVLEFVKHIPDKLFDGAIVTYPRNNIASKNILRQKVVAAVKELHVLLDIQKDFKKSEEELCSYDIAHHAGLSLEQEYEMLELLEENQRLEYLRLHLLKVMPVINEMETLKKRVQLNGHFKNLSGFDFN